VFDPRTGDPMDLWLLLGHELSCSLGMGFGLRPARVREDGSQEHLKLSDMKQLLGWLFETYGLPPYTCHLKFERGTATVSEGTAAAIQELFGNLPDGSPRIICHFSSMLGGKAPSGYAERKVGNARGKASLESTNRLRHTIAADVIGQTGPLYTQRPADLIAREKEAVAIWRLSLALPEHLRGNVQYPVVTITQARAELRRIFHLSNARDQHAIEGFEEIVEGYDPSSGKWVRANSCNSCQQFRSRKESPYERAARLRAPYAAQWTAVSPDIITAFYEHTQREVKIDDNGEIEFTVDGTKTLFVPAGHTSHKSHSSHKSLLGYLNADQPGLLFVTDGRGSFVGAWLRKTLASNEEELQAAIRYQAAAVSAARQSADALNAGERERLEAMRKHNEELLAANTFIDIAEVPARHSSTVASPLASALTGSVEKTRTQLKTEKKQRAEDTADARDILMDEML
jgi:hypothetical protein